MKTPFLVMSTLALAVIASATWIVDAHGLESPAMRLQAITHDSNPRIEYTPGEVVVKLRDGVALSHLVSNSLYANRSSLDAVLTRFSVRDNIQLFARAKSPRLAPDLLRIYRLKLDANADVLAAVAALSADPNVEYAEPNYIARAAAVPNDPLYSSQWGLDKIGAASAWDVITGTPGVVIAVLDTGIDTTHPDLVDQLWVNPGETPGNGIDDDNNGYVDDVNGWNFIAQTNEVMDDDGHGTRVAGVAATTANNGQGIAGMCWNCRVMSVKVMQPGGFANYSDVALGVAYAAAKGAKVINISLGGYADSPTLRNAIASASSTAMIVAAAGDDNVSTPFYPAAYPNVLSVGGTDNSDTRASFSNYGSWINIAAPAVAITTTLTGGTYGPASGTSLAAPLVSGLAGLIWSQHPDWSPALVRLQVLNTADAVTDTQLGAGRVNAANAVTQVPHPLFAIDSTAVDGDPLGRPTPGSASALAITLRNNWLDANNATGILTTTDPYVTIVTGTAAYGSIAAGSIGTSVPVYSFTVASGASYNHPIPFALSLSSNSGAYTLTLPLTITTRSADQSVGGTIVADTTWTNDKTYIVNNNVGVAPGVTLAIQPGAVIRFNGYYTLSVGGMLIADGTADQPIRFMSNITGTWSGIYFDNSSVDATTDVSGTYQSGNILRWVHIESAAQGIGCNSATPYLSYVTLTGSGVNCTPGNTILWVQDSTLAGGLSVSGGGQVWRNMITGGGISLSGQATVRDNTVRNGISTGNDSLVQGNIAGGTINAPGASIVRNNTVTMGGISVGNSANVLTNTVRRGGITASDGSLVQHNDVEGATAGWGISANGTITLTHNRVVGNVNGVNTNNGLVQSNLIANNVGIGLQVGAATALSNTLTGNGGNGLVIASGTPAISGNNLEGNHGVYDFVNNTANVISTISNWWGTTDSAAIDARVYDFLDDFNLGQVTYVPVLTGPAQTAPAYVRSVTISPDTTLGIQTGVFTVDFSRAMDTVSSVQTSFAATSGVSWATRASMPTARYDLGVAAANNGRIYAIGGHTGGSPVAMVEEYDPATNTWVARASMPTARTQLGVAVANNGKIYAIGGWPSGAAVEEYDPATDTWASRASMPTGRYDLGVVAASNGKIYAMGGWYTAAVEEYDPATDTWVSRSNMPEVRFGFGVAAANNGKIYVFGGYRNGWSETATVLEYDPATDTWATRASMPRPTAQLCAVLGSNDKIYAIGGRQGGTPLAAVEEYDPTTDTWASRASMSRGRQSLYAVAASNGKIYAIGGQDIVALDKVDEATLPVESSAFYNPQWLSSTQYRASYDINSLVPKGAYSITVSGALGSDGVSIASNSNYTFTVDYIGTGETATPPAPTVRACASTLTTTLSAQWTVPTTQSIGLYRYAIGTAPGLNDATNWITTAATSITRANLNLLPGQAYYFSVEARNTGGIWSDIGSSNSVVAGTGGCPQVNFSATPTSGMSPLAVTFTPQISGTTTSRIWSFGNGVTSTQSSPVYTYTVTGPGSAVYTITLDVFGPGGWSSAVKSSYVSVAPDTVPPSGSVTINGGAAYVATTTVGLDIVASDPSGLNGMRLSNDGVSYSTWVSYTPAVLWTLTSGDGLKTVYAQVRDVPGNIATFTGTIILDTTPPAAMVSPLPQYVGSTTFTVTWMGYDVYAGLQNFDVQLREGAGGTWTDWLTATTQMSATVTGIHGQTYYFRARARDVLDNLGSYTLGDGDTHTTVDLLPPIGNLLINGNAVTTTNPMVTLSFNVSDTSGVAAFQVSNDGITYTGWLSYTPNYSWTLAPGLGERTVYAHLRDLVGHESAPITDTITVVDTTPPIVTMNPLLPYQTSLTFAVKWSGFDAQSAVDSFDVQVRDGNDAWTDWLTATTELSATFTGLDGHIFYFRVRARDVLGNLSDYTPAVFTRVDTTRPEGDIAINGGAIDTTDRNVVLVLTANGASEMAFSNDGVSFGAYEPFAAARAYLLTTDDGLKAVYVRYRDPAGNASDYSDTIILNTSVPGDVGLTINNDDQVTEQVTVTLTLKAPPGTRDIMISNSSRFVAADWEPYSITRTWMLAYHPYVSVYQVYARFRGIDGTISPRYDDIITLHLLEPPPPIDSTPPSGSLVINADADSTSSPNVTLDVLADDNPGGLGVKWMYFREWKYDPVVVQWVTVRSSGWLPYSETSGTPWALVSGTGMKYVGAWFADGANNVSNPVVLDSINLIEPGDTISAAQVTQYRQTFTPGQQVTVTLVVTGGDADLYIWRPGSIAAPDYWSNRSGTATEQLVFTAIEGEYVIEVHGYLSSQYQLDIATSDAGGVKKVEKSARTHQSMIGQAALIKPLPQRPLVTTRPGSTQPTEQPRHFVYLPLLQRGN